jgi:hypothetical protein
MMNESTNTIDVKPGMLVFTLDGKQLGPVESIDEDRCIRVHTHTVPPAAIERVDTEGVHLRLAQAAFAAASPITRDTAAPTED